MKGCRLIGWKVFVAMLTVLAINSTGHKTAQAGQPVEDKTNTSAQQKTESIPKPPGVEPSEYAQDRSVPRSNGFHHGYGYRPMGYAFWPRYGHYSDFSRQARRPEYYSRPYQWHPFRYWHYWHEYRAN